MLEFLEDGFIVEPVAAAGGANGRRMDEAVPTLCLPCRILHRGEADEGRCWGSELVKSGEVFVVLALFTFTRH